ncbi:hypothetical protein KL909_005449, partial [Ogataea angusta]
SKIHVKTLQILDRCPSVLQNPVNQRIGPNVSSFGLQCEENEVLPNEWLESIGRDEQRAT